MTEQPSAAFIIIGNEILSGRTQDRNLNYLALFLIKIGIRLAEVRVIPDDGPTIIDTVRTLSSVHDYVFTSGGIGPTHDDITAENIAKAFDCTLTRNPEAYARLEAHYATRPEEFNDARQRMALIPEGSVLIDNPISAAPGFYIKNTFVLAGVPSIFQAMLDQIRHLLKGGDIIQSRAITTHVTEGTIATALGTIQKTHPTVEIGSYPYIKDGQLGVSIVLRGSDARTLDAVENAVNTLLSTYVR